MCVMRAFEIYIPRNFQVENMALPIIITVLYVRFPGVICLRNWSFYPSPNISLFSPFSASGNHCYFVSVDCLSWTFYRNGIIPYVVFCVWLLSLSIKLSHVAFNNTLLLLVFLYMDIPHLFSLVDGHFNCFHFLGIVNNATMNACV